MWKNVLRVLTIFSFLFVGISPVRASCTPIQDYPTYCYPDSTLGGCSSSSFCIGGIEPRYNVYIRTPANDSACAGRPGGAIYSYRYTVYCCPPGESPDGCAASCFLPGTKISTPDGDKDIETLKPGDKVLSFDEKTGETVENTVDQSIVSQRDEYYIIKTASGKEVKATAEHPFYTGEQESERVKGQETEKPQKKVEQILDFIKNIPKYLRLGIKDVFGK